MKDPKGTTDEAIGRPGPVREGRYQQQGQPLDESVQSPPGSDPNPDRPVSKPVTRKDYEFPGEGADRGKSGDADSPGGDAG